MFQHKYNISRRGLWVLAILVTSLYLVLNFRAWNWYIHSKNEPCTTPLNELDDLRALVLDTHEVLEKLRLTHILIAGR